MATLLAIIVLAFLVFVVVYCWQVGVLANVIIGAIAMTILAILAIEEKYEP